MSEAKDKKMTYEDAMAELRQTVAKLSEGKATLDESLKLYERGIELVNICETKLNEVTARIEAVNKANGTTDPLNISESGV
ncbi:MAG: exodeoxyribonuclease VII small subunit [Saccharofermentans sp.]|nr:exodeoxyribonuclease VII small subunit [Saccharofermentans sp.]